MAKLTFHPLTADRWNDLETLFGPRGACAGCWCRYWKLPRAEFAAGSGDKNRRAFRREVVTGGVPGILAYAGETAIGWCAVEPRESYPRLEKARTLKRVDDTPVWSITCFFVAKEHRRGGVSVALLEAVVAHVRKMGGKVVEGYPTTVRKGRLPDAWVYTGVEPAFLRAGFSEVARPSATRPIYRRAVRKGAPLRSPASSRSES